MSPFVRAMGFEPMCHQTTLSALYKSEGIRPLEKAVMYPNIFEKVYDILMSSYNPF